MTRTLVLVVSSLLMVAAPGWASSFKIYEDSLGSPGVTALFAPGTGLVADIDFDASSAEGGGLLFGASEIRIVPLGDAVLTAFSCQLSGGCTQNVDYVFTAGGAGVGEIIVTDPDIDPKTGLYELGDITFTSLVSGSLRLTGCNYTDANGGEQSCDAFTLVQTPEPGTALLLGLGLVGLARMRRQRA